ncbi:MAG: helix-turn-helix domain-containing protein [Candidatus Ornithomonoglobus sp.]
MLRLKELRKQRKITQTEVAKQLNVSQTTYSSWETGRTQMDYASLIKTAALFDVTVDYLLGRAPKKTSYKRVCYAPVYGDMGLNKSQAIPELIGFEPVLKKGLYDSGCFWLKVPDNSLEPRAAKGDILLVLRHNRYRNGDMVVLYIDSEYITVKRVYKNNYGIILTECNQEAVPEFYSRKEIIDKKIKIIGRVVEIRCRL